MPLRSARDFMNEGGGRRPDVVAPLASAGITFVMGGVGMGKTLLGLELAVTKASGMSRIGLTAEAGAVLFIAGDMAAEDYREYLAMVVGDREEAWDNLQIATPRELYLDEDDGTMALREAIVNSRAGLVVMDYFDRFLLSDGYHPKELRPIINTLSDIRDEDRVALVMLDQTRKQGNGAKKNTAPAADELFGGRAKSALADRILRLHKDAASGTFTVTPAKERGAPFAPINLTFDAEGGWRRDESERLHLTPGDERIRVFIDAAGAGQGRTCMEIQQDTRLSESAVRHALARLQGFGLVGPGPKVVRSSTYKSATLHNSAIQSALADPTNSATLHSPYKGVQQSSGVQIPDAADVLRGAMRSSCETP
jgi:hypothetical protein